jgi:PDZ domain-containing protein
LGIVDKLTPGELTGGLHVAGTGTIDSSGNVGPIGGIEQKMYGAHQRGATVFLAPEANCGDVVGNVPDGMQVVKVATLEDAVEAVSLLGEGKDGSALPACG